MRGIKKEDTLIYNLHPLSGEFLFFYSVAAPSQPLIIHMGNEKPSGTTCHVSRSHLLGDRKSRRFSPFLPSPLFIGATVTQGLEVFMLKRRNCNAVH